MDKSTLGLAALGLVLAGASGAALAAPDWSKVPSRKVVVFYPGTASLDWIMNGTQHGGAKGLKKGEACIGCHEDEKSHNVDIASDKILKGEKLEPKPVAGRVPTIPVTVQAANDGTHLYLRFSWKDAGGGAEKLDKDNPVKFGVMLENNKVVAKDTRGATVQIGQAGGCWGTCHADARTMPGAADTKTKYVTGGSVASGNYYDLMQWKSGKGAKAVDGHVADKRVMDGGKALVKAEGKKEGDTWVVTFTRKLAGGDGDIALASGKTYNMGFAIHNDHAAGRFHHVSFGYSLGIDAKADITAAK
jgi:hypothetical protein